MRPEHTWIWTAACSSGSAGGRLDGGGEGAGSRSGEGRLRLGRLGLGYWGKTGDGDEDEDPFSRHGLGAFY